MQYEWWDYDILNYVLQWMNEMNIIPINIKSYIHEL